MVWKESADETENEEFFSDIGNNVYMLYVIAGNDYCHCLENGWWQQYFKYRRYFDIYSE